jgi:hypothetical protein
MAGGAEERRIELTVRRVEGALCGSARDLTGGSREFTGWLGLLAVLEALVNDSGPASTTDGG